MTIEDFKKLVADRHRKKVRGRDVRKMEKPYSCREVLFTCSNGWTIELLPPEDHPIEGFFMGHCMGGPNSTDIGRTCASLREPDGTPHVTLDLCYGPENLMNAPHWPLSGRCNGFPKPEYIKLINEFAEFVWGSNRFNFPETRGKNAIYDRWGPDTDDEYHESGVWTDTDFRDLPGGTLYRGEEWKAKRENSAAEKQPPQRELALKFVSLGNS